MTVESDSVFLARRRDEHLARLQEATDPAIAKIHRDFAHRYERAIQALNAVTSQLAR